MIIYNRDKEIIERARHRLVTACVYMQTPEFQETFPQAIFRRAAKIPSEDSSFVVYTSRIMSPDQFVTRGEDLCEPEIEKDPALRRQIQKNIKARNQALAMGGLSSDEQDVLFDSADLVDKATGIPTGFAVVFNQASPIEAQVATLPFVALRGKLMAVQLELEKRGGRLQGMEVAHTSAISAFDYNKIASRKFSSGYDRAYGQVMLDNANRALDQVGIPPVYPNYPPTKKFH